MDAMDMVDMVESQQQSFNQTLNPKTKNQNSQKYIPQKKNTYSQEQYNYNNTNNNNNMMSSKVFDSADSFMISDIRGEWIIKEPKDKIGKIKFKPIPKQLSDQNFMYRFGGAPSEPSIMSNNKSLYRPKSSYGVTKVNPISEVDNKNWPRINVPFNFETRQHYFQRAELNKMEMRQPPDPRLIYQYSNPKPLINKKIKNDSELTDKKYLIGSWFNLKQELANLFDIILKNKPDFIREVINNSGANRHLMVEQSEMSIRLRHNLKELMNKLIPEPYYKEVQNWWAQIEFIETQLNWLLLLKETMFFYDYTLFYEIIHDESYDILSTQKDNVQKIWKTTEIKFKQLIYDFPQGWPIYENMQEKSSSILLWIDLLLASRQFLDRINRFNSQTELKQVIKSMKINEREKEIEDQIVYFIDHSPLQSNYLIKIRNTLKDIQKTQLVYYKFFIQFTQDERFTYLREFYNYLKIRNRFFYELQEKEKFMGNNLRLIDRKKLLQQLDAFWVDAEEQYEQFANFAESFNRSQYYQELLLMRELFQKTIGMIKIKRQQYRNAIKNLERFRNSPPKNQPQRPSTKKDPKDDKNNEPTPKPHEDKVQSQQTGSRYKVEFIAKKRGSDGDELTGEIYAQQKQQSDQETNYYQRVSNLFIQQYEVRNNFPEFRSRQSFQKSSVQRRIIKIPEKPVFQPFFNIYEMLALYMKYQNIAVQDLFNEFLIYGGKLISPQEFEEKICKILGMKQKEYDFSALFANFNQENNENISKFKFRQKIEPQIEKVDLQQFESTVKRRIEDYIVATGDLIQEFKQQEITEEPGQIQKETFIEILKEGHRELFNDTVFKFMFQTFDLLTQQGSSVDFLKFLSLGQKQELKHRDSEGEYSQNKKQSSNNQFSTTEQRKLLATASSVKGAEEPIYNIYEMLALYMKYQNIATVSDIFSQFDFNQDGLISPVEFQVKISQILGMKLMEYDFRALFANFDEDNDSNINIFEFLQKIQPQIEKVDLQQFETTVKRGIEDYIVATGELIQEFNEQEIAEEPGQIQTETFIKILKAKNHRLFTDTVFNYMFQTFDLLTQQGSSVDFLLFLSLGLKDELGYVYLNILAAQNLVSSDSKQSNSFSAKIYLNNQFYQKDNLVDNEIWEFSVVRPLQISKQTQIIIEIFDEKNQKIGVLSIIDPVSLLNNPDQLIYNDYYNLQQNEGSNTNGKFIYIQSQFVPYEYALKSGYNEKTFPRVYAVSEAAEAVLGLIYGEFRVKFQNIALYLQNTQKSKIALYFYNSLIAQEKIVIEDLQQSPDDDIITINQTFKLSFKIYNKDMNKLQEDADLVFLLLINGKDYASLPFSVQDIISHPNYQFEIDEQFISGEFLNSDQLEPQIQCSIEWIPSQDSLNLPPQVQEQNDVEQPLNNDYQENYQENQNQEIVDIDN